MNLMMIGKTYLRLKNKEKAVSYLTRARDYPAASAEDMEVIIGQIPISKRKVCNLILTLQAKQEAVKLLGSI